MPLRKINRLDAAAALCLAAINASLAAGAAAPAPRPTPAPGEIRHMLSDSANPENTVKVAEAVDIALVWSGHNVNFSLVTHGDMQFVAFYDAQRRMTVGARHLTDKTWKFAVLPETVKWDSHNYITMTADAGGYLHLSGNMHANPLVYFKTTKPLDITTFERVHSLVGENETRVTYPIFMRGVGGQFLFTYRDGQSGNGNQIYDVYDEKSGAWHRLLDKPLTDGEGHRNAYMDQPKLGPDGYYHTVWVWRESGDASTNHDPAYARSRDMLHWEKADGTPLALPITLKTGDVVDPVPMKGGIINNNVHVGFDAEKRPIVSYHKYDAKGNIQIYSARHEAGGWKVYQTSDWNWRWDFGGGGTLAFEVGLGPVILQPDGKLIQRWNTVHHGSGTWILDPATLKPIGTLTEPPVYPAKFRDPESAFTGMRVNVTGDSGRSPEHGVRYVLRWETLGPNRDQPRTGPLPEPTMLRVYKLTGP